MTTTSKRLFGPAQLGNSAATVYTCPALTTARITRIHVTNPDSVARTFTLSIGADAAGTRLWSAYTVNAGGTFDAWGPFTLAAGDIIQAYSSTAGNMVMEIDGTEQT